MRADTDQSLMIALGGEFAKKIKCYPLPPTFVSGRTGVDVEINGGAVTIVWKTDFGKLDDSIFSMCVVDGCSKDFKLEYRQVFKSRYTELDGIKSVINAIEKLIGISTLINK